MTKGKLIDIDIEMNDGSHFKQQFQIDHGVSINFRGTFETVDEITDPKFNDLFLIKETGHLMLFDGNEFISKGQIDIPYQKRYKCNFEDTTPLFSFDKFDICYIGGSTNNSGICVSTNDNTTTTIGGFHKTLYGLGSYSNYIITNFVVNSSPKVIPDVAINMTHEIRDVYFYDNSDPYTIYNVSLRKSGDHVFMIMWKEKFK